MTDTLLSWEPLTRQDVARAIERRSPSRIPLVRCKWWGEGLNSHFGDRLREFDQYPEDIIDVGMYPFPDYAMMGLSWELPSGGAHDSSVILDDWAKLDEFIEKMPDPSKDVRIEKLRPQADRAHSLDRYLMYTQWRLFYERPWEIRGMENLMTDYYMYPEQVHRLNRALCDLYISYLRVLAREIRPDGFWTSDDLGHQTQLMMPPPIFREFLLPYYHQIGKALRELNMHWWLHSCGNNTDILPDLADAGVTAFHPVQKGTMDELETAKNNGNRLSFCAGIDVQHVLQEQDPDGVRKEVRFLIDTFDRPDGGMCIAAGNGILPGTPIENIHAFLDEALRYGASHRNRF